MLSLSIFLSSSNLILQATLCLSLTVFLSFLNVPALLLYGLYTYVHPDDVSPNNSSRGGGIKAAIRRPGTIESELKPRKKSKEKFEFDENKAQIFRLKLNDAHLQSRIYFKEFSAAFNSTVVAISSLLLQKFLRVSKDSGTLKNGSFIPILLGFAGICRVFFLISKLSFDRSASKESEKLLSVVLGVVGFFWGLAIVFGMVPHWVIDFDFQSLDGLWKFFIAIFMGCLVGFFYVPAMKNARAFWLGTDQIRSSLSIISCGWFARMLLYTNYFLVVFTSALWIRPFSILVLNERTEATGGSHLIGGSSDAVKLAGTVGMTQSDFHKFRLWCLFSWGVLQIVCLRPNAQMFLNEAVLCWYQRLHASKVPDLAYSRAKVFLHNHYICLVLLQFFAPAAMVLLFVGLSRINDNFFADLHWLCIMFPCSPLVTEVSLFMAWWAVLIWAMITSMALALYRHGVLYVS